MSDLSNFVPIRLILPGWPTSLVSMPNEIDQIGLAEFDVTSSGASSIAGGGVVQILTEMEFDLPLIPGLSLAFFNNGDFTEIEFDIEFSLDWLALTLPSVSAALRIQSDILKRQVKVGDKFEDAPVDPTTGDPLPVEIVIEDAGVTFNSNGEFGFTFEEGAPTLTIQPFMIGDSGLIVDIQKLQLILSEETAQGLPNTISSDSRGVYLEEATIHLPDELSDILPNDIGFEEAFIGSGGFSGKVSLDWEADRNITEYDEADAKSFLGFSFSLQKLEIEFIQNTLVGSSIIGFLKLPFFDEPVQVELGLTNDGDFTIALADPDGLLTLEKENIISIDVTSLEFIKEDNTFSIKLSGKITPLLAGLNWPSFELKGLTIGSDGTVKVDGGWIELPDQKALDFHGFQIEIAKLGFGSDELDGVLYKWVGFSGGIQIVQALPMRGGVEGLKVMWTEGGDFKLKIGGVYLSFDIKDVLSFDGSVFFIDEPDKKEFRGSVDLSLIPINLGIDAQFITGKTTDYNYFYIAVDLDLPIGIPLGPPVLGLYGLAGLYGHNMTLDYKDLIDYEGVDNRPELTDVENWYNQKGAMAFGAGLTVGTLPDSKFTVKAKALFVILIPGPVLLIEGHAGMLSINDSYMMQVLAVLDPASGTFLLNISAGYQFPKPNGELLDISGSAEAYFSTADPSSWHLYLGENKPESKRIRADIYSFFKAQTYLMIDNDGLSMGAWIGYGLDKKYGILRVVLEAWMSGELSISTMPLQAKGKVSLYGNAELSAKIVKLGISVEADVTVQAPKPIGIEASLKVQLKTGVGKLKATIKLNWAKPALPPYPMPLSATLGIEHRKVAQNWDIQKYSTYQVDDDGLYPGSITGNTSLSNIPVVPPDVYMVLNFDKPVNDVGLVGSNPATITSNEKVGDYKFKYELINVALQFRDEWDELSDNDDGDWEEYTNQDGDTAYSLSGSWQAMPDEDEMVNTKLVLNASTPFEISRLLEEKEMWYGLLGVYNPNYPCTSIPELEELCADFEDRARAYYYGIIEQDAYLFSSPYPMIVRGYEAPWLGTSNALMNTDNYMTTVCLNIKAQEETEAFQLKIIEDVIFSAGIGYDSYLKLTDEYSKADVELYVSSSQLDLDNQIIPVFIHFPKLSFEYIPHEVWITCIIIDYTVFYAFDEDGNTMDTHVVEKGDTIIQFKLSSTGPPIRKIGMLGNAIRILDICYSVFHPVETMNILVTAPEDIIKADIHLSKNSNGTIYVYDEDNAEVQQIPFDISGSLADDEVLPIVIETQSHDPFRSFLVSGWFDIIRVCGVTQEAQDIYNYNANLETHLQESLEENWGKHTAQILYPNKYYRLKIETATSRKKNKGSWEPEEFTEYMYFKTGNPPGPAASIQKAVGTEPKDRYDLEGPLRDLTPYVDYTIPAGATADEPQTRVYRSYDIGVAYTDSYVDQMYQMAGLPLKIRLLDNNNLPVLNAAGQELIFDNLWGDNPELSLTTEETVYADVLDASGCITMVSVDVETNAIAIASSRDLLMKPQTQYRAQVVAQGVAEEDTSIYEFAFITSRYANFMHHIHSFEDAVWNHFDLLNDPGYSTDAATLEQILTNGEEEHVQFEQLMEHFGLNPRMTPEQLEITLINDSNASYGLLIEGPEPLDWLRTELKLSYSATNVGIDPHDAKVKIIEGTLAPSQWIDVLIMESSDMSDWIVEYRDLTSTDEADYLQYFEFPADGVYNAGVHIRIHNGEEPLLTTGDTEETHLYAGHTTEILPTDGTQIRIKNSDGEVLHQRIIQSAATLFIQKNITIIKKEDESKCFVFVNNGGQLFTSLKTGLYKLDFTYDRSIDEAYPILTRFGFEGVEEATLKFSLPLIL